MLAPICICIIVPNYVQQEQEILECYKELLF